MSTKKKGKESAALAELKKRTAALMEPGGAGSDQAARALGKSSKSSAGSAKKTKSLYLTEDDEQKLRTMAAGLLVDGVKASESILIRAAIRVADPTSTAYRREVAAMLEERGESLKAGYIKRGASKGR